MKKTDKGSEQVLDDKIIQGLDFQKLSKAFPALESQLMAFKSRLVDAEFDFEQLKVWEVSDLGISSSSKIMTSSDPLVMLRDISQNFPSLANVLSRERIDPDKAKLITATSNNLEGYSDLVWINNIGYSASDLDPSVLYDTLQTQFLGYEVLTDLGFKPAANLYKLLSVQITKSSNIQIDLTSPSVSYLNDLSKDNMYRRWHQNIEAILQPTYQGQLNYIGQNVYTAILVLDASATQSFDIITTCFNHIGQYFPVRYGIFWDIKDEAGELAYKLWKLREANPSSLAQLAQQLTYVAEGHDRLTPEMIATIITLGDLVQFEKDVVRNQKDLKAKGLAGDSPRLFVNGFAVETDFGESFAHSIYHKLLELREHIKQDVREGKLSKAKHDGDYHSALLEIGGALPSYNRLVLPKSSSDLAFVSLVTPTAKQILQDTKYFTTDSERDSIKSVTHLLVTNLATARDRDVVRNALKEIGKSPNIVSRVGLVSNGKPNSLIDAVLAILTVPCATLGPNQKLTLVDKLLETERSEAEVTKFIESQLASSCFTKFNEVRSVIASSDLLLQSKFVNEIGLQDGAFGIITNGRFIVLERDQEFDSFSVLARVEYNSRGEPVQALIEGMSYSIDPDLVTSDFLSDMNQQVVSYLNMAEMPTSSAWVQPPWEPSFRVVPNQEPDITMTAVIDPLSPAAQKLSPMLISLSKHFDIDLRVLLKTQLKLSDLPLKNYYRYVADPLEFNEDGSLARGGVAVFENLPPKRLLTMTIQEPPSWLVSASSSAHDLDNIILQNIDSEVVHAAFQLDHILVEGSCADRSNHGQPPRALELILGDSIQAHQQDSLVMSNLGYFQLKANPGVWKIELAEGRSRSIYEIDGPTGDIYVETLKGPATQLKVKKRKGMEQVSLFDEQNDDEASWMSSLFGGQKEEKKKDQPKDDTLHIFSLASGHLYERFLKIMMWSVMQHTKGPVKFWFLSNFLSPAFKNFLPKYAEKYGFEVELVTYKWPAWLHGQTEKQRIIWGYKILFLDVLFPINVTKIIYVDADQVVRTDMRELRDMDLHGAPYGYTPFCSGKIQNPATTGFRFWDSGFWAQHLGSRPYHISALYVVDLYRLRKTAAADKLRATYDGLSRDPNSLANLDQDLPNYMQSMVPIYSLPGNWLWCETWCTMESRDDAKTIDLCNNPLTKAPKLQRAVELVPEWQGYDDAIREFENSLKDNQSNQKPEVVGQKDLAEKIDL